MKKERATILVVDDSLVNLRFVQGVLKNEYTVYTANGGREGLQQAISLKPDLILLDIMMPDLDGYDVCRQIKQTPALADTPIIFISALNQVADESRGLALGAVDYLYKPTNTGLLQLRVRNHLELKMKADQLHRQQRKLEKLVNKMRLASSVFENSNEGIVITDRNEQILMVNPAFTKVTGYSPQEVRGQTPRLLKSDRHTAHFYAAMWRELQTSGNWRGEIWNRRKNGEIYPELLSISAIAAADGRTTHYIAVFTDISELKEKESRLDYLAYHDPLTGLGNRRMFETRHALALERSRRNGSYCALLLLDLDHFKDVNDSFGHPAGDELLVQASQRIMARLRGTDSVCRMGGDEFAVVLEDQQDPQDAAWVAADLLELLQQPFQLAEVGREVTIGVSIGIALYPDHGKTGQELLRQADTALYQAKQKGRNRFRFFTSELTRSAREQMDLEAQLRHALVNNELLAVYQPQLELSSGRIIGAEALLRWNHPVHGTIMPDRFIPLAEKTGLINEMGVWILREVCRQGVIWRQSGLSPLKLSVNLSPHQLYTADISETVAAILAETGFPAAFLDLEVTESALMEHAAESFSLLHRLNLLGVQLSLDDFGTGYSSLARIKELPLDLLKIDRSFIKDITQDKTDHAITATIIAMSRTLGLKVTAEGVETAEQLAFLSNLNCDYYQGYLASRPLPAAQFEPFLRYNQTIE